MARRKVSKRFRRVLTASSQLRPKRQPCTGDVRIFSSFHRSCPARAPLCEATYEGVEHE
jgi:hypothetical protein